MESDIHKLRNARLHILSKRLWLLRRVLAIGIERDEAHKVLGKARSRFDDAFSDAVMRYGDDSCKYENDSRYIDARCGFDDATETCHALLSQVEGCRSKLRDLSSKLDKLDKKRFPLELVYARERFESQPTRYRSRRYLALSRIAAKQATRLLLSDG